MGGLCYFHNTIEVRFADKVLGHQVLR